MKNLKKILILLIIIFATPLFFACSNNSQKVELSTLSFVNVVKDDDRTVLVTDNNVFASSYIFGISENSNAMELSLNSFLTYNSTVPYLDVTNVFTMPKTYYFYAIAVGEGIYESSTATQIYSYDNKYVLGTPSVKIVGTNLSWTEINNATDYSIYCNNNFIAKALNTFYDFSVLITQAIPYEFKIIANGTGYFTSSNFSPSIYYTSHLKLTTPTSLVIDSNQNLTWQSVTNAVNYTVLINGTQILTSTNFVNLSNYLNQVGEYFIQVKANAYSNYLESDYSLVKTYTKNGQLENPQNIYYIINGNNIEIYWDSVENASSYTIKIDGQIFSSNIYENCVAISFSSLNVSSISQLRQKNIQIKANGIGLYLESGYSSVTFVNYNLI